MPDIEIKVQTIRQYIYNKKNVDIVNINVHTHDDIMKLNWAYDYIIKNQ